MRVVFAAKVFRRKFHFKQQLHGDKVSGNVEMREQRRDSAASGRQLASQLHGRLWRWVRRHLVLRQLYTEQWVSSVHNAALLLVQKMADILNQPLLLRVQEETQER